MKTTTPSPAVNAATQLPVVHSPAWWQTLRALFNQLGYLEEAQSRCGGNFAGTAINFPNYAVFSHPKAIEQIFTANPNCFDSGVGNKNLQPLLGDFSLVLLDGKSHQKQRKLLMPPFHGERMRAYSQTMYDITQQVIQKWQPNQPFEMRTSTQ